MCEPNITCKPAFLPSHIRCRHCSCSLRHIAYRNVPPPHSALLLASSSACSHVPSQHVSMCGGEGGPSSPPHAAPTHPAAHAAAHAATPACAHCSRVWRLAAWVAHSLIHAQDQAGCLCCRLQRVELHQRRLPHKRRKRVCHAPAIDINTIVLRTGCARVYVSVGGSNTGARVVQGGRMDCVQNDMITRAAEGDNQRSRPFSSPSQCTTSSAAGITPCQSHLQVRASGEAD